jgi:hypothetical protein
LTVQNSNAWLTPGFYRKPQLQNINNFWLPNLENTMSDFLIITKLNSHYICIHVQCMYACWHTNRQFNNILHSPFQLCSK